jgi:O-acetyl-ADP-ribose deacetylase (regulator of RNase III)/uncharacterized protein YeaO (DUF488 family)
MDIYTAQYAYSGPDRLDITVKGQDLVGKTYAPTWDLVNRFKSGEADEDQYTREFAALMNGRYRYESAYMESLATREGTTTLVCFCPPGAFCHRIIVAEGLEKLGAVYKGERNICFENIDIYEEGDLLEKKEGFILQQVNCRGVMGAGLAKAIADKYPVVLEQYSKVCKSEKPEELLGKVQFVSVDERLYIINLFGQLDYGRDEKRYTNYSKLRVAFNSAAKGIGITEGLFKENLPIYMPYRMSCGLAGGDWYTVYKMVKNIIPRARVIRKG